MFSSTYHHMYTFTWKTDSTCQKKHYKRLINKDLPICRFSVNVLCFIWRVKKHKIEGVMKYLFLLFFLVISVLALNESYAREISSSIPVQADNPKPKPLNIHYSPLAKYKQKVFFDWINTHAFMRKIDSSKERILARKAWKKGLGVDIFYPYFELKKAKNVIEDKTEVNLFKMKGKAKIERDEIKYIFRARF